MPILKVINPPKKRIKMKHRKVTIIKASKLFGRVKRLKKIARRKLHKILKHSLALRARRKKIIRTHKRKNPFMAELAVLGNSPKLKRRHNKMAKHKKHHRRHNPAKALSMAGFMAPAKEMISGSFVTEAVGVAVGFMAPNMVLGFLPVGFRDSKIKIYGSKIASVVLLAGVGRMVSPRVSKMVLLGGAVSLIMDIYADFICPMIPAKVGAYYGDNMGAYYGDGISDIGGSVGDSFGDQNENF